MVAFRYCDILKIPKKIIFRIGHDNYKNSTICSLNCINF